MVMATKSKNRNDAVPILLQQKLQVQMGQLLHLLFNFTFLLFTLRHYE